jgi:DNA polymerase III epsilon subunit-like protein
MTIKILKKVYIEKVRNNIDSKKMEKGDRYFFFDLETTSLDTEKARIVEIAYLIVKSGEIEKQVDKIIKPDGYVISEQSTAIHKISNQMAIDQGEDIMDVMKELMVDLVGIKYIIGHNIRRYDIPVLSNNLRRIGMMIKWDEYNIEDTIDAQRIKLGDMYRHLFGKELENAHNALSDVIGTYECYRKIKEEGIDMSKENVDTDRDNNIITFGKYSNYRYCEILKDKNYCEWLLSQNNTRELSILKAYIMDKYMRNRYINNLVISIHDIVGVIKFSREMNKIMMKIKIETYRYGSRYKINKSRYVTNEIYYGVIDYMIRYMIMKGVNKRIYEYGYSENNEIEKKYINLEANKNDIINLVHRKYGKKLNLNEIIDTGCMELIREVVGYVLYENKEINNVFIDKKIKGKQVYSDSYLVNGNNLISINRNNRKISKESFMEMIVYGIIEEKKFENIMIYDINQNEIYSISGNIDYKNLKGIIEEKII